MDHGADCINTGLSVMAYLQIINANYMWSYLAFYFLFSIFFYVTLEEYYFGSLDFPILNAVNEGTTSTFIILLLGVFFGNDFYQKEIVFGFNIYQCILIGLLALIVIQNLVIMVKLFIKYKFSDVLMKNLLFVYATLSYVLVVVLSQNDVVWKYSKVILYIYTILFSRIIITIMIAHIFDSNFNQCQVFPILLSTIMIVLALVEKLFLDGIFPFN